MQTWVPAYTNQMGPDWFHFSFDQGQGRVVYASGSSGGYRSNDGGRNFVDCAQTGVAFGGTNTDLAIAPRDSFNLFLATRGRGVLASTDGCQSWQESNTGLDSLFANTIAIDPNNPETVYAGTDGGAYVSFDGGNTWNQINDGLLGATVVYSIVVDKDSNVYAATPYGIFTLESNP